MLPKKVKIGGFTYSITFPHTFETSDDYLGLHIWPYLNIKVADMYCGKKRPADAILETFLHECFHAVNCGYGSSSPDHGGLTQLSKGWFQVLVDNTLSLTGGALPKKVKIGGFTYRVVPDYVFKDELHEVYSAGNNEEGIFRLSSSDDAGTFPDSFVKMNLVELITYSICYVCIGENSDISESLCSMSRGIFQFLVDNNIEKLVKEIKNGK